MLNLTYAQALLTLNFIVPTKVPFSMTGGTIAITSCLAVKLLLSPCGEVELDSRAYGMAEPYEVPLLFASNYVTKI